MRRGGQFPVLLLLLVFLCLQTCLLSFRRDVAAQEALGSEPMLQDYWSEEKEDEVDVVQSHQGSPSLGGGCDMSVGEWIYDRSYPLYDASCPYLSTQVSCRRNGRPDHDYERWRWKPQRCSLPRFNALDFLARMRRKRVVLVGDSMMRNQWESLVCMVEAVIPDEMKTVTTHETSTAFHALDFETSIEFHWAPLLVELEAGGGNKTILHLDSIEENAKHWRGADVLVFDSAHWWTHSGKWSSWDVYMENGRVFTDLNPMVAYEKGLLTWAKWVDMNLDPRRTRVVFRSVSPRHNRNNGWQCYRQRTPLLQLGRSHRTPAQLMVLREVVKKMSFPVYVQDVTAMSALRRDGHPSIYHTPSGNGRARLYPGGPAATSDCSHWCLPGVPDTWNEILYSMNL